MSTENKFNISAEIAGAVMSMPNIKNQPLKVGDEIELSAQMQNTYAPAAGQSKGYTDYYFTARVNGSKAVKIPTSELLKMTGATEPDGKGGFNPLSRFKVVASTPRLGTDDKILFPLTKSTKYAAFLKEVQAGTKSFTQEEVATLRAFIPADLPKEQAIQDYTVESLG